MYRQHAHTPLRSYQARICEKLVTGNHLVVLPTGSGARDFNMSRLQLGSRWARELAQRRAVQACRAWQ
jgi:hypothetical protein